MKSNLIVCIDGLGNDLISRENTPFLYEFGMKNSLSELQTLFAFTGIEYCFFSGKNPDETNLWLEFAKEENSIFNSPLIRWFGVGKLKSYLGAFIQLINKRTWMSGLYHIPKNKLKYFDTSAKEGLWKLDFFRNKSFSFYKWPFFVTEKRKKLVFRYENDDERMKRILSEKNKEIYYTQLMSIDKTLHRFGKGSPEIKRELKKIDKLIARYVKYFLSKNPEGDVFLWGDHSLANINNYIDIQKMLPKSREYLSFIEGTTACFWFKNERIKKRVIEALRRNKEIKLLNSAKAKEYHIPMSKKYGELVAYVEKGNYFFPNFYQKKQNEGFMAMHGYPDDLEMNGMIISNIKIPKRIKMSEAINYLQ
jgi:predicted AlkP superfamily pyrophosphatase or phosphodiesterase